MVRGTTPNIILTVPENVDLLEATNIYVTFSQIKELDKTNYYDNDATITVTKTGDALTVDAHSVSVYLTQEESLTFTEHWIEVQLNWTYPDGKRGATKTAKIAINKQLLNEVVE